MDPMAAGPRLYVGEGEGGTPCDLCDGRDFQSIGKCDRRGRPLETVVCTHCGLVSHGHIPTEAELAAFYANDYRRAYHGEATPSHRRVMRAWRMGERIHRQVAPFLQPADRVLEVGCGAGCTVKVFELAGHDASGIEPNAGFRAYAADRLHGRVDQAFLYDVPRYPQYDVVLLVHVIEHFRSARQALEHIYATLRPGGRLYVECPNLAAPFARPSRLFHFAHVFNFTPTTLAGMARRCGFEVVRQFNADSYPNLQMLLVKASPQPDAIDAAGYAATMQALHRYNALTYNLRLSYAAMRLGTLAGYVREFFTARQYVERCLARCDEAARQERPRALRIAA
ncbi:MAG: class I SAM-dependent methyltransferase [Planctomycetia bacterium]|nr:class I SAM-dependent methyltransferase [Planctomycetia bacterium]